jgi:hypothetical protein
MITAAEHGRGDAASAGTAQGCTPASAPRATGYRREHDLAMINPNHIVALDDDVHRGRIRLHTARRMRIRAELRRRLRGVSPAAEDIHAAAPSHGMIDLRQYAATLLPEGLTAVDAATSVVSIET